MKEVIKDVNSHKYGRLTVADAISFTIHFRASLFRQGLRVSSRLPSGLRVSALSQVAVHASCHYIHSTNSTRLSLSPIDFPYYYVFH